MSLPILNYNQDMSDYMSYFKNPCKVFLRYLIQKALGKFLVNPVQLTNQDFSKNELNLNDLKFNCQVLNDLILSEADSPFRIIQCNVKKLTIRNWLSLQVKMQANNTPVEVVVSEVDVIVMPVSVNGEQPSFLVESHQPHQKQNDKPELKAVQEPMFKETVNSIIKTFLGNLTLKLDTLCVRVLTQEQTQPYQQVPTVLLRMHDLELVKTKSKPYDYSLLTEVHCLLNSKNLSFSRFSCHLMAAHKIYQQFEYTSPIKPDVDTRCPFAYPTVAHPSTIFLVSGKGETNALICSFNVSQQHSGSSKIWCLHTNIDLDSIDAVLTLGQMSELQNLVKNLDSAEPVPAQKQKCQPEDSSLLQLKDQINVKHVAKSGKQSRQKQIKFVNKNNTGWSRNKDLSVIKQQFFQDFGEFVINDDYLKHGGSQLEIQSNLSDEHNQTEQEIVNEIQFSEADDQDLNLSQVLQEDSRKQTVRNMHMDVEMKVSSVSFCLLVDMQKPFEYFDDHYDRVFIGQQTNRNQHLYHCDYLQLSMESLFSTTQCFRVHELRKVSKESKSNPFGSELAKSQDLIDDRMVLQMGKQIEQMEITASVGGLQVSLHLIRDKQANGDEEQSSVFLSAIDESLSNLGISTSLAHFDVLNKVFRADSTLSILKSHCLLKANQIQFELKQSSGSQTKNDSGDLKVKVAGGISSTFNLHVLSHLILLGACAQAWIPSSQQERKKQKQNLVDQTSSVHIPSVRIRIDLNEGEFTANHFMKLLQIQEQGDAFIQEVVCQLKDLPVEEQDQIQSKVEVKLDQISVKNLQNCMINSIFVEIDQNLTPFEIGGAALFIEKPILLENEEKNESGSQSSSDDGQNFVIYEDDESSDSANAFELPKKFEEKQVQLQPRPTVCFSIQQFNILVDKQIVTALHSKTLPSLMPLIQGAMCFQKAGQLSIPDKSLKEIGQITQIKLILENTNLALQKHFKPGQQPTVLCLVKLHNTLAQLTLTPSASADQIDLKLSLKDFIVMDFCQQAHKIYNKLLHQARVGTDRKGNRTVQPSGDSIRESFFDSNTTTFKMDTSWLCAATPVQLVQAHEKCLVICRHSLCLKQATKAAIECSLSFTIDKCKHYEFTQEEFLKLAAQVDDSDYKQSTKVKALFDAVGELETDSMLVTGKIMIRDLYVRTEAILCQKQDEDGEEYKQMQSSKLLYELAKSQSNLGHIQCEQISVKSEILAITANLDKVQDEPLKLNVATFRETRGISNPEVLVKDFEVHSTNLGVDFHPVIQFKDYIRVFGSQLKHIDFLTFNENLKFKVSQRMVVFLQDFNCVADVNQPRQAIKVTWSNFSVNILDQTATVDDEYNPVSLLPGLELDGITPRPQISLNTFVPGCSNCTYLESLGFIRFFLSDCGQMTYRESVSNFGENPDTQTDSFEVILSDQVSTLNCQRSMKVKEISLDLKKISLYTTSDSLQTMTFLAQSLESNLKSLTGLASEIVVKQPPHQQQLPVSIPMASEPLIPNPSVSNLLDQIVNQQPEFEIVDDLGDANHQKQGYLFVINQINHMNMRRWGAVSVPIEQMIQPNYIPNFKKMSIKQTQKSSKWHQRPQMSVPGLFGNQNDYEQMQPKVFIQMHLQSVEFKLFQGHDFDFVNSHKPLCVSSSSLDWDSQLRISSITGDFRKSSIRNSKIVLDDDYLDPVKNQKLGDKLFFQSVELRTRGAAGLITDSFEQSFNQIESDVSFQPASSCQLRRKRCSNRGGYLQVVLRNVLVTSFRSKNINFRKKTDLICFEAMKTRMSAMDCSNQTPYKLDSKAVTIHSLEVKETVSSRGKVAKDCLFLPYAYKFDNFLNFSLGSDLYSSCELLSLKSEVQPIKLKIRQDLLVFLLDFGGKNEEKPKQTKSNPKQTKQSVPTVLVKEVKIKPFSMSVSYSSSQLKLNELVSKGNMLEVLNLMNINNLLLEIKQFELQPGSRLSIQEVWEQFMKSQVDDILANQKMNIIGALGPMKGICNISSAFYSILSTNPLDSDNLVRGMKHRVESAYDVLQEESVNLSKRLVKVGKSAVQQIYQN